MTSDKPLREIIGDAAHDCQSVSITGDAYLLGDAIIAALRAAGLTIEEDWRPIEEAKKDGTRVIMAATAWSTVWEGYYRFEREIGMAPQTFAQIGPGWTRTNQMDVHLNPTMFRPLPPAPTEAKG